MAALALVVYAMALPECYEISCGAYAFAFVITMGASGEYPMAVLVSRAWVGDDARRRHGVAAVLLFARLPLMLR